MSVTYSAPVDLRSTPKKKEPFILLTSFVVKWQREGKPLVEFEIEESFTTDLASIPRVARSIIPQVGKHLQPAVVHDWCYEKSRTSEPMGLTRAEADMLFLEGMKNPAGVWWLRRNIMYGAVRTFGGSLWGGDK